MGGRPSGDPARFDVIIPALSGNGFDDGMIARGVQDIVVAEVEGDVSDALHARLMIALRVGVEQEIAAAEIPLYTFINPAGLDARGRNLYTPTEASGDEVEGVPGTDNVGTLAQGFLEMSNVEVVDEMVNMIVGQRAYEVNSKAIQTSDSMLGTAVQLKRS